MPPDMIPPTENSPKDRTEGNKVSDGAHTLCYMQSEQPKSSQACTNPAVMHSEYGRVAQEMIHVLPYRHLAIVPRRTTSFSSSHSARTNVYPTSSLRLMKSPAPFETQDKALHFTKAYFQRYIEDIKRSPHCSDQYAVRPQQLYRKILNACVAIEYNLSNINVEAARIEMLQLIPNAVKYDLSLVFSYLMEAWVRLSRSKSRGRTSYLLRNVTDSIADTLGKGHPLPLLLEAASHSSEDIGAFCERLLMFGGAYLTSALGVGDNRAADILHGLYGVYRHMDDWEDALRSAAEQQSIELQTFQSDMTEANLSKVLSSKRRLAQCHAALGHHDIAKKTVEEGLEMCGCVESTLDRDTIRLNLLQIQGNVSFQLGQFAKSLDCFNEALRLTLRWYGAGDATSAIIAERIAFVLQMQSGEVI